MANRRCAEWRLPTEKQSLAEETTRRMRAAVATPLASGLTPSAPPDAAPLGMPPEYWESVLNDPRAGAPSADSPIHQNRLSEISRHLLRVSCRRCDRVVEIQTADAVRLYGRHATWKEAGARLLDDGCRQRKGSRDDDGCWPNFETS